MESQDKKSRLGTIVTFPRKEELLKKNLREALNSYEALKSSVVITFPYQMVRDGKIITWKEYKEDKKMNGWTLTKVWQIDHKLVVAKTIEDAIALFKIYMGKDYRDEPKHISAIGTDAMLRDYDALIKEDEK